MNRMKVLAVMLLVACTGVAADVIDVFGYHWTVPAASDWKVEKQGGVPVLRLITPRGPVPGPRRPIQFALAETPEFRSVTVDLDARPQGHSLIVVFGYRDAAHFDYAHLSTDSGEKEHVHNGVFHVYGGERVRISPEAGPAAFAATDRWYHVRLTQDGGSGAVEVTVNDRTIPALHAIDSSLSSGRVGIGSFDETGDFKKIRIKGVAISAEGSHREPSR